MSSFGRTANRYYIILACILVCCACITVCLAWQTIWVSDDIVYRFHFQTQSPITSFGDVISSQITHYFTRNGRFIAHVFAQVCIALWGRPLFSVVNGLVYVAFICLLWRVCKVDGNWKYALYVVLLAFLGLQTKYTPCFQINYIWMFSLVLGYLLLFFHFKKTYSRLYAIGLVPFGIIAGWSNEALVVGISVSLVVYVWKNRKSVTFNQWLMFFSFGIGAALLCLSPGTIGRTKSPVGSMDFLSPGIYSLIKLLYYSRVSYLLILYVFYLKVFKKIRFKDLYREGAFYIHAFAVLLVFNLCIGVFSNRQLFGMELMAVILLVTYWKKYTGNGRLLNGMIVVLLLWGGYKVCFNYTFLQRQQQLFNYFYAEYEKSKDGTVFYDLSRDEVTLYETYPSYVFTPRVLKSMDTYFHYLKDDKEKTFKVYPTCCKRIDTFHEQGYVNNAKGAWTVWVLKNDEPAQIEQVRQIGFLGWKRPFKKKHVTSFDLLYENEDYKVYQLYDKMPFVEGVGFEFF